MRHKLVGAVSVLLWTALGTPVAMGYTNTSSVLDGSGTMSSGGSFTNISAAGQPGGISVSSGGTYVNQAGFLNTFSIKPGLDTDGDGVADELDQDNDNDKLADTAEVAGSGFSPTAPTLVNIADTDGDGVMDATVVDEDLDGEFDAATFEDGSTEDLTTPDEPTEFDTDQYISDSVDGIMTDVQLSEGW